MKALIYVHLLLVLLNSFCFVSSRRVLDPDLEKLSSIFHGLKALFTSKLGDNFAFSIPESKLNLTISEFAASYSPSFFEKLDFQSINLKHQLITLHDDLIDGAHLEIFASSKTFSEFMLNKCPVSPLLTAKTRIFLTALRDNVSEIDIPDLSKPLESELSRLIPDADISVAEVRQGLFVLLVMEMESLPYSEERDKNSRSILSTLYEHSNMKIRNYHKLLKEKGLKAFFIDDEPWISLIPLSYLENEDSFREKLSTHLILSSEIPTLHKYCAIKLDDTLLNLFGDRGQNNSSMNLKSNRWLMIAFMGCVIHFLMWTK